MNNESYIPGVCNIGQAEIRQRALVGYLAAVATVVVVVILVMTGAPWYLRLAVFFPAAGAAVSFLQARLHFCAAYGIRGLFNVKSAAGKAETVEQKEFRDQDRRAANRIIRYSIVVGAAVAVAVGMW